MRVNVAVDGAALPQLKCIPPRLRVFGQRNPGQIALPALVCLSTTVKSEVHSRTGSGQVPYIMTLKSNLLMLALTAMLAACGGQKNESGGQIGNHVETPPEEEETIWDLFSGNEDAKTQVEVNKYLWRASLELLDFLPIQSVDPYTGIITTGYGTPPGGGRAYRATIYIQDPALDARSLKVALLTRSGPVGADTERAVEDAILTRARQLRIQAGNL